MTVYWEGTTIPKTYKELEQDYYMCSTDYQKKLADFEQLVEFKQQLLDAAELKFVVQVERIRELEDEVNDWKETADRMMDESEQRGQRIARAREILSHLHGQPARYIYKDQLREALAALEGKE